MLDSFSRTWGDNGSRTQCGLARARNCTTGKPLHARMPAVHAGGGACALLPQSVCAHLFQRGHEAHHVLQVLHLPRQPKGGVADVAASRRE